MAVVVVVVVGGTGQHGFSFPHTAEKNPCNRDPHDAAGVGAGAAWRAAGARVVGAPAPGTPGRPGSRHAEAVLTRIVFLLPAVPPRASAPAAAPRY